MTNTEATENLSFALESAKRSYERAVLDLYGATQAEYFDAAHQAQWQMETLIKRQFEYQAFSIAVERGLDAFAAFLAEALGSSARSTSLFSNATAVTRSETARDLISAWRAYIPAEVLLSRV